MAPIDSTSNLTALVDKYIAENTVVIFSKSWCPYCTKVKALFDELGEKYFAVELDQIGEGDAIQQLLAERTGQRTVPSVFVKGIHLGGCDNTIKANQEGRLAALLHQPKHEYDLIVIGGGSGGLAASKEAAAHGKKVAVLDFVKPSPKGTTWGLGGTCVNVGCIPKKLMHQAALLGQSVKDAKKFGWEFSEEVKHNWDTMKTAIQNHIGSLNWGYRVQLREKKVQYLNSYGRFVSDNTITAVDKKGKETKMTADHFILAMGMRPRYPDIPGAKEYGITSDDLFSLSYCPGKTLVVGASYVALECAGFLKAIGLDVTIMVRSILLRGFDQDMAERVGAYMVSEGIEMVRDQVPVKVEEVNSGEPGLLKVTSKDSLGELTVREYNTVLFAIGRDACTGEIGLDNIGVKLNPSNGKVITNQREQSSVPYVHAVGDIVDGKLELTPVAIEAGKLLSKRLFSGSERECDYLNVPTTVFTPLEYGCIGYSEEKAIEHFGEDDIEVYHGNFWPLEYTVAKRSENDCYVKLICVISQNERVVGFHYLGPNAGEVTQGFALGIKLGATKKDFDALIGIHPTCAEFFTTLTVTKRSGASVTASGC